MRLSVRRVGQALMQAANVSGIPHSFVVDATGTIRYSGHPAQPAFAAAVQQAIPPSTCTCTHTHSHTPVRIPVDVEINWVMYKGGNAIFVSASYDEFGFNTTGLHGYVRINTSDCSHKCSKVHAQCCRHIQACMHA